MNAKLANPLEGIPQEQLMDDAEAFAKKYGLGELSDVFRKAALVAQDPLGFESLPQLSDEDKECLRREVTHRWDQPKMLYYLVILCSVAAAVQGVSCHALGSRSFLFMDLLPRWTRLWSTVLSYSTLLNSISILASVERLEEEINGCSAWSTLPHTYVLLLNIPCKDAHRSAWQLCCAVLGCWLTDPVCGISLYMLT